MTTILTGDALKKLRTLPDASVQMCVTSPPYYGLRDYGIPPQIWGGDPNHSHEWVTERSAPLTGGTGAASAKQITNRGTQGGAQTPIGRALCSCGAWRGSLGLEPTIELYVAHIVEVFREVRRVLKDDGTLWLNLGDSYNSQPGQRSTDDKAGTKQASNRGSNDVGSRSCPTLKPKDLVGIPWRVAFALQADGWYLRSDIIWHKTNPMPESVTDRPTKAHEYLFLLSKGQRYYYDAKAIKEPASADTHARYARGRGDKHKWSDGGPGNQTIATNRPGSLFARAAGVNPKCAAPGTGIKQNSSFSAAVKDVVEFRNKRTVWKISTKPFKGAHFATFPPKLIEPCILAGSRKGDAVLDPFFGAGTVGVVTEQHQRDCIGIELNPSYVKMARERIAPPPLKRKAA